MGKVQNRSLLFKDIEKRDEYSVLFEPAGIQVIMDGLSNDRSKSINVSNVHLKVMESIAEPYKALIRTISARILHDWWEVQVLCSRKKYKKCPR